MAQRIGYDSTRFVRPDQSTSSLDDTAKQTKEAISQVSKRDSYGWSVFFAGDRQTIDTIAGNNAYITNITAVYKDEHNGNFIKKVRKGIMDQNADFDGVVFCGPPEDVMEFRGKNQYAYENRFLPPVVYFSDRLIESERRLMNVWHVDTKDKPTILLKQDLIEAIEAGKNFVEYMKKASLIIMSRNPGLYVELKERNPDTVHVVPATEEGYYQVKAFLESFDIEVNNPRSKLHGKIYNGNNVVVGGVAIDALDEHQLRLSLKMENEGPLAGIPFVYIGNDPTIHFHLKQFERCKIIPGEDIQQKGLMRLLEDYDPSKKEVKGEVKVHDEAGVFRVDANGKKVRSLKAKFDDFEIPKDPGAETQFVYRKEPASEKEIADKGDDDLLDRLRRITAEIEEEQEAKKRKNEEERDAFYAALERFNR